MVYLLIKLGEKSKKKGGKGMSSWSGSQDCPECDSKGSLKTYGSNKPYDTGGGECLECGFTYSTIEGQMTLDEVNGARANYGLEPLEKLKGKTDGT